MVVVGATEVVVGATEVVGAVVVVGATEVVGAVVVVGADELLPHEAANKVTARSKEIFCMIKYLTNA